jgi:MFS family permease
MEWRNATVFFITWQLMFLAAPVIYVGVVQAALCDKLGASPTIANLPASAWLLGYIAPFFLTYFIPLRLEASVVVWTNAVSAVSMALVCAALLLPVGNAIRIAFVVGQGLVYGILGSLSGVYIFQCLGRGTTTEGRAKTLKWTYTAGPIIAVIASVGAQYVLNRGISVLPYPYDFALLYSIGVPCLAGVAFVSRRYELPPAEEPEQQPFIPYIAESLRKYLRLRYLVLLWLGYFCWFLTLNAMSNFSLFTKVAIGRDPKELSGVIQALRFGFKAMAGFGLGAIALRWGERAPIIATVILFMISIVWAWTMPGYLYLVCFGFMGAAELGAAYFINYTLAVSPPADGARNLSLLQLAIPVSSISPVLHGSVTDSWGFRASFALGLVTTLFALAAVIRLPSRLMPLSINQRK